MTSRNPSAADPDARMVMECIRRIVQALRVSSRTVERRVGISAAQLFLISKLAAAEDPLSINELAEETLTHQSSVSVVVKKLESRGLVARTRSRDDGRRMELSLTPAARSILRKAPEAAQERLIEALHAMPPNHRQRLASFLQEVVERIGATGGAPPMMFDDDHPPRKRK